MKNGKHLDIGCGEKPRNPYSYSELYGLDVSMPIGFPSHASFKQANLVVDDIPFEADLFDAVSAFDFIEHVPRIFPRSDRGVVYPFIELMNEVWRVLKPNGRFYAVTPAFPRPEAFQDPTHVNIITDKTHEYFCGEKPFGTIYGFKGKFEPIDVRWVTKKNTYTIDQTFKKRLRGWHRLLKGEGRSHLLWELKAIK